MSLLFLNLGGGEIILILLVILIFFGAKKIPELARGLGQGMREFRKASQEIQENIENAGNSLPENKPAEPKKNTNNNNVEDAKIVE
ncbi:MAG: twin-arginine translocase TatA/TatE family subunit [Bacteroidia bacterium]|nr:twin-arginine translocase TatA/TatE family subunit [Bacteroidia bacterium]MDW8302203.1 twin-arginine translocase TatA/TatE family subunit [Bacteroidia bacterium]